MRDYVIYTDSSADFDKKMIEELGVKVLSLSFTIDGQTRQDDPFNPKYSLKEFYDEMRADHLPSTSQLNVTEFLVAFNDDLAAGKDILYLGFSSGLSGTVNSGAIAAAELQETHPGSKIVVVDTLCASLGQGLLVYLAVQQKKAGKSLDEVAEWTEANKLNLVHWFTVEDLKYLKNGGRVSSAAAFFGTMLNIKPVLHVDNEGHLIPMEKVRGRKQSLDALADRMQATAIKPEDQYVFISHADSLEDAKYLRDEIKKRMHVKEFYLNNIGPVIGSHSGPGTMALFFVGTER